GLDLQPDTGRVFSAEHGPSIDDEVNLVIPAGYDGWDHYAGGQYNQNVTMTDTAALPDAVEASWSSGAPTLAPAGIAFLDDPSWGEWNGALAVAMLKTQQIVLMMPSEDGRSVTRTATVIPGEHGRPRSLTAEPGGTLLPPPPTAEATMRSCGSARPAPHPGSSPLSPGLRWRTGPFCQRGLAEVGHTASVSLGARPPRALACRRQSRRTARAASASATAYPAPWPAECVARGCSWCSGTRSRQPAVSGRASS